jgi:hypothetical protein
VVTVGEAEDKDVRKARKEQKKAARALKKQQTNEQVGAAQNGHLILASCFFEMVLCVVQTELEMDEQGVLGEVEEIPQQAAVPARLIRTFEEMSGLFREFLGPTWQSFLHAFWCVPGQSAR